MINSLVADVRSYLRVRDARIALAELNDAALDDIGMTRADIAFLSARPEPARTTSASVRDRLRAYLAFQPAAQAA